MKLLNEILGTKYPIIQGGMANIATGEFAAACSNAGALGIIGAGGMNADTLRQNIRRCRELTDKPFGVNIMLMHPQADEFAQIVVEEKVAVVTTGAGNPGKYVPMWKAAGIKVIPVVAAAVLARHLEPLGIDAVIAEGTESGRSQTVRGLGLLPIQTVFTDAKHRTQDTATVTAPQLAGAALTGYQIHTGRTAVQGVPFCRLADGSAEGCVKDNVAGTYLHGLFDTGELTEKLVQLLCSRKGISPADAPLLSMQEYRQQQVSPSLPMSVSLHGL